MECAMPAETIVVICVTLGFFAVFIAAVAYGQWVTRDIR
jgi:hypothetical protein